MASLDPNDDASIHRLEGSSGEQKGGLVIMKKGPSSGAEQHVFKAPEMRGSMLGLDRLAAAKRKLKEDEGEETKKSKVTSYKNDWEEDAEDEDDSRYRKNDSNRTKERFVKQLTVQSDN